MNANIMDNFFLANAATAEEPTEVTFEILIQINKF